LACDIFIVDDEADIRESLSGILSDDGYAPRAGKNSEAALVAIQEHEPSLVILDIWLENSSLDGLELLEHIRTHYPLLPVVMISGHGNIETAVSAIRQGAYDFIEKPFTADHLLLVVSRAIEAGRLRRENEELRVRFGQESDLVGATSAINSMRAAIEKVARTGSRVLISGPAGSGKEVAARLLHNRSRRAHGPFVVINAARMAPDTIELEIFGAEAGAPSPDSPRKVGIFEQAHQGTLFIDEVADMPLETQGRILRVLQDQTFSRLGGREQIRVDVRVVSGSSRNLSEEISEGRFREDLYHRLAVVPIRVPPLSERRQDIPLLAQHFMNRIEQSSGLPARSIADDTMALLQAKDWPGNVRELRNMIERLLIMAPGDTETPIHGDLLTSEIRSSGTSFLRRAHNGEVMAMPLREAREVFEREYLLAQIQRFGGNISRTASYVGMERSALHRKLKALGVTGGSGRA
jgi:two-component system nitrogen regulation response regulator NtrX